MANIKNVKPGQTLYDVKRNTGLAALRSKYSIWTVYVQSVNIEEGYIVASWNGNPLTKMFQGQISWLRVKEPK